MGFKHTEETKAKLREMALKRVYSEEHKERARAMCQKMNSSMEFQQLQAGPFVKSQR